MKPPKAVLERLKNDGYVIEDYWLGHPLWMCAYAKKNTEFFLVTVAAVTGKSCVEILKSVDRFDIL